jgi:acyl-CoA-binding protein
MKTTIRTSTTSTTGYEMVVITPEGIETVTSIDNFDPNNPKSLKLPENPSNRKYLSIAAIEKAGGTLELTYKAPRTMTKSDTPKVQTPKAIKGLEEYLEGDEKAEYLRLVDKAQKLAQIAALKASIASTLAEIEALENGEAAE